MLQGIGGEGLGPRGEHWRPSGHPGCRGVQEPAEQDTAPAALCPVQPGRVSEATPLSASCALSLWPRSVEPTVRLTALAYHILEQ